MKFTECCGIEQDKRKLNDFLVLLLIAAGSLLVHGYHPYSEDAEIYLPGVERILNPQLFPVGREFFQSHASMTLFPNLVALSIRVTHLPLDVGLFLWHVASIFLLLLACWEVASLCFPTACARWAAVGMVAGLLTIPIAGTALYIADQYLNPRNLAAFAALFAVARTLEGTYGRALLWLMFAGSVHPLMWVFPFSFCVLLWVMKRFDAGTEAGLIPAGTACLLLLIPLNPKATAAYHEAAKLHANHYIQNWEWYEILGALAPIALFWWFGQIARAKDWTTIRRLCRAFIVYDAIYVALALILDLPPQFESLARLQPLRSLHLLYVVMFLIMGGLLGEFVLKGRLWRWLALFVPLSLGMLAAQRVLFPLSAHMEWPGMAPRNPWAQAFVWVREHTDEHSIFAIDPGYMHIEGEDEIGFRCLAQRSRLADAIKDNGVVSMFPLIAEAWWIQVQEQSPWKSMTLESFQRLKAKYGVDWVIVQQPGVVGLHCVYQNPAVRVCQVP